MNDPENQPLERPEAQSSKKQWSKPELKALEISENTKSGPLINISEDAFYRPS
ncbi:hypothetical protein [Pelagicoccus sp. SDUM812003]|uniref:hypothetical protein n=1 Tax=Pelagicoccus sp. SDUM812003 TaxID=3041267 RepID=UPI00280FEA9A|nr:hypothetical protein [Pelagicoccus sp. SDUM812003]MDQ8205646.1 hypothetical protein [Pelagicoccus sp. SDUM812003]